MDEMKFKSRTIMKKKWMSSETYCFCNEAVACNPGNCLRSEIFTIERNAGMTFHLMSLFKVLIDLSSSQSFQCPVAPSEVENYYFYLFLFNEIQISVDSGRSIAEWIYGIICKSEIYRCFPVTCPIQQRSVSPRKEPKKDQKNDVFILIIRNNDKGWIWMMRIMMRGSKPNSLSYKRFDRNNSLKALFIGGEKFISPIFIVYMGK